MLDLNDMRPCKGSCFRFPAHSECPRQAYKDLASHETQDRRLPIHAAVSCHAVPLVRRVPQRRPAQPRRRTTGGAARKLGVHCAAGRTASEGEEGRNSVIVDPKRYLGYILPISRPWEHSMRAFPLPFAVLFPWPPTFGMPARKTKKRSKQEPLGRLVEDRTSNPRRRRRAT